MAGIKFDETMDGYYGENIRGYRDGEDYGVRHGKAMKFDVSIEIDSVDEFVGISKHEARLRGKFYCTSIGAEKGMVIKSGSFNLFSLDPRTGHRRMLYSFNFTSPGGVTYTLSGYKDIFHDNDADLFDDMTTLFVRIYEGKGESGKIYASGVMYFRIKDMASIVKMLGSAEVTVAANIFEKYKALTRFTGFFLQGIAATYTPLQRFIQTLYIKKSYINGFT